MDLSTVSFSEFETAQVQELLLEFVITESSHEFVGGKFVSNSKRLSGAFIFEHFGCDESKANQLLSELTCGQFLDAERLTPLPKGDGSRERKESSPHSPKRSRGDRQGLGHRCWRRQCEAASKSLCRES